MMEALKKWARLYRRSVAPGAAPGATRQTRTRTSALYGGMGERELQLRMELTFKDFLTNRNYNVFTPAKQLAAFSLSEQERFLKAAEQLAQINPNLAYCFCSDGIEALTKMDEAQWNKWLTTLEQQLHDRGEDAAIQYLKQLDSYLQMITLPQNAVILKDVAPVIERLLTALGGRRLTIQADEETFTDTEQIYLPQHCSDFSDADKNFSFYKVCAVFLWAQLRFGTWRIDIARLLYDPPDSDKAVALFQVLENLRLDACIERELPGVARVIAKLGRQSEQLSDAAPWRRAAHALAQPDATAQDSLDLVTTLYRSPLPRATVYQGLFKPVRVMRAMKKRIAVERVAFEEELSRVTAKLSTPESKAKFTLNVDRGSADLYHLKLSRDGEAVEVTPEMERLLKSVMQDFGEVPPDYLHADNDGKTEQSDAAQADATQAGTAQAGDDSAATLLPEWDHSIQQYRPDWCRVFLRKIPEGDPDFAAQTLVRHGNLVKQLRRTFEALRESDCRQRHEPYGDDINLDAAVATFIDAQRGEEPDPGAYIRHSKSARNIAVVFLVDMSGSTAGWINQVEKEALVLLCESLEMLGDRYAIYGFSGETRERCNLFKIKSFEESYDDGIKRGIGGITPQNYTRMGAAIRFVRKKLLEVDAKTRLMITLSDGRPDDRGGYYGQYGIEDTRCALLETSFQGIHPYCITIDTEVPDYLPYMYGSANFSIVNRIEKLPFQVSDIYRRITS